MILNLDLVIVAIFIPKSVNALTIDYFAAARVIASVVGYSDSLAYGLYPSILSGDNPREKANHVFELQAMILAPMLIGAIVLGYRLLTLLNVNYTPGTVIIIPLSISYAFYSLRPLVEGVIMGSEKVDTGEKMTVKQYFKSKLFLVSKIDLATSFGYLASVFVFSIILADYTQVSFLGLTGLVIIGLVWGFANLGRSFVTLLLKWVQAHKIARLAIPLKTALAVILSSGIFGFALYEINKIPIFAPSRGKIFQATELLVVGVLGLAVYVVVLYLLSGSARKLAKEIVSSIF